MLLLFATAVLSCSVIMNDAMAPGTDELSVTVTGTASDIVSGVPIEEIKIILHCSDEVVEKDEPIIEKSAYTDDSGKYSIRMSGFSKPVSFLVIAEDPNGVYEPSVLEIPLVDWDSDYSVENGTFFVNGCDFHLKKAD